MHREGSEEDLLNPGGVWPLFPTARTATIV